MKFSLPYLIILISNCVYMGTFIYTQARYDLTIVGPIRFADGLNGISYSIIDCLKDKLKINYKSTSKIDFNNIPSKEIKDLIYYNQNKIAGNVAIFTDLLWTSCSNPSNYMPSESIVKIAYSMLEGTLIPQEWAKILNNKFDAVVVPDNCLVNVYKNSGVTIPIFVLPCIIYIDELLSLPIKKSSQKPFTFGMVGGFGPDKNHDLVLEAFKAEFGNSPNVELRMHGRGDLNSLVYKNLVNKIARYNLRNVKLTSHQLSRKEYINFIASLDCYVLLSRGEGFSITPREAMALGIPCILSNNSAHKTICNTEFVKSVKSDIPFPSDYSIFGNYTGHKYNSTLKDAKEALAHVYTNYAFYLAKSVQTRKWVKQYTLSYLHQRYLNLVKPHKVILGKKNEITDEYLMTDSKKLYAKYIQLKH